VGLVGPFLDHDMLDLSVDPRSDGPADRDALGAQIDRSVSPILHSLRQASGVARRPFRVGPARKARGARPHIWGWVLVLLGAAPRPLTAPFVAPAALVLVDGNGYGAELEIEYWEGGENDVWRAGV